MRFKRIRKSMLLRVIVAAVGSALLTLTALAVTTTPASAYVLGTAHYDPNSINPIQYRFFSVGSLYVTASKSAEAAWDATTAPGYFAESTWSLDPEVNVIDGAYGAGFWARTIGADANGDHLWDGNEVQVDFNTNGMASLTANQKQIVAEHELGHAYGLNENNGMCCVMQQGNNKFTCGRMPANDDITGVDAIY